MSGVGFYCLKLKSPGIATRGAWAFTVAKIA